MTARAAVAVCALLAATGCFRGGWYSVRAERAQAPGLGTPVALDAAAGCPALSAGATGPVVVVVHGIAGDVPNVGEVHESLASLSPRALLAFRWAMYEKTDALLARFSGGLNRLVACTGGAVPIVVLAHSAGGVLASLAANRLEPASDGERAVVVVVTVASPLGGVDRASARAEWFSQKPFALELGGKISRYPAPPPGVQYVHVRTSPKADVVMQPAPSGHRPDDPRAVVPGARQHELPEHVGHDDALLWAVRALAQRREPFGVTSVD